LYWDNPYSYLYGAWTERERDVLSAKFALSYEIIDGLKASLTAMRNSRNDLFYERVDDGLKFGPAYFGTSTDKRIEDNLQAMLSYDRHFGDLSVIANVGLNYRTNTRDYLGMNTS